MARIGDWFQTYTGRRFYPLDPRPEDIHPIDIAVGLSNTARFNGHTKSFYSVAQYSVLVSLHVPDEYALAALLHDASEAYLGDVVRPLKYSEAMAGYREVEVRLEEMIAQVFRLPWPMPACIKEADNRALATERRDILHPGPAWSLVADPFTNIIHPETPQKAWRSFWSRWKHLGVAL